MQFLRSCIIKRNIRIIRKDLKLNAFQLLCRVIAVDLNDLKLGKSSFSFTFGAVVLDVLDSFVFPVDAHNVLNCLAAVACNFRLICDDDTGGVRNGKCNACPARLFVRPDSTADGVCHFSVSRIRHDIYRTVVKAQVRTEDIRHLHRLSVVKRCLRPIEGDPVFRIPGRSPQLSRVQKFFVEELIFRFIIEFSFMITPCRGVFQIISASVRDCQLFKIHSILQFKDIADLIVGIKGPVLLPGKSIDPHLESVIGFRIGDRRVSLILVVLVASGDIHLIMVRVLTSEPIPVEFKQGCFIFIFHDQRFAEISRKDKGIPERRRFFTVRASCENIAILFDRGLAEYDCFRCCLTVDADGVRMVLNPAAFFIACFQPVLIHSGGQPDPDRMASGHSKKTVSRHSVFTAGERDNDLGLVSGVHSIMLICKQPIDIQRSRDIQIIYRAVAWKTYPL